MIDHKIKKSFSLTPARYLLAACACVLSCAAVFHAGGGTDNSGTERAGRSVDLTKDTVLRSSAEGTKPDTMSATGRRGGCVTAAAADDTTDTAWETDNLIGKADTLYDNAVSDLESLVWDSTKINFARLDSGIWTDTVRIVLADTAKARQFCPPISGAITSNFGQRKWRWHYGTDVKLTTGDTVRSAFDGIVRLVAYDRHGYGHVIVVRHASGLETLYGHLSKTIASQGQAVKAGEVIGLGGNTGHSTGPHLHFEMRYYGHAFDPCCIVDFDSCRCRLRQDTLVLTKENFEYLVELRKQKWHTICRGNTLGSIARQYHTTIPKLCSLNHITRKTVLSIGRKIRYQ